MDSINADKLVIQQCLHMHRKAEDTHEDMQSFHLCPQKLAIFRANEILQEREKLGMQWPIPEFLSRWNLRLPNGITGDLNLLPGVALKADGPEATEGMLIYFPENRLPITIEDRFMALFTFRTAWSLVEMQPYLRALVVGSITEASLLLKHARACRTSTGDYVYSARKL